MSVNYMLRKFISINGKEKEKPGMRKTSCTTRICWILEEKPVNWPMQKQDGSLWRHIQWKKKRYKKKKKKRKKTSTKKK